MKELTQARLKELLDYDMDTGVFTWKNYRHSKMPNKQKAGSFDTWGYIKISVDNKLYRAHRLAWLFVYGEMPLLQIDHINGIRTDNRIANLRKVNNAENQQNIKKAQINNKCGLLGVRFHKHANKYEARIQKDNKPIHLGYYETPQQAHEKYLEAKKQHHKFSTIQDTV
jgi:hypothetical protein